MFFRKFWLLIWKNMLLRRRHWVITTFEVLLPTLCAGILAYSNKQLFELIKEREADLGSLAGGGPTIKVIREKTYDPISEDSLVNILKSAGSIGVMCSSGCPYAPSSVHSDKIMSEAQRFLQRHNVDVLFNPQDTEQDIENMLVEQSLSKSDKKTIFDMAVIFDGGYPITGDLSDMPVSYRIRLKYRYAPNAIRFGGEPIMPVDDTERLFPEDVFDPYSQYGEPQKFSYYKSGFIGFQLAVDNAIIKVLTGRDVKDGVALQPFPIPSYARREEELSLTYLFHSMVLPTFLVLGFIFIIPSIMLGVVSEKETGIRELLKMNGVPGWLQWIGWLANSLMVLILSVTIVTALLFLNTVQYGDPGVWYFILMLYMVSAVSCCFFLSSFFNRPILATIVGIILWLVSYFPVFAYFELITGGVTFSQKMWSCLSPNVAFYLAVKIMMTYERDGVGAQWSNILTPVNPGRRFSLGYVVLMFFANTSLFLVLTVYLENVLPSEFGVRRPFYYLFLPSTWGLPSNLTELRKKLQQSKAQVSTPESKKSHASSKMAEEAFLEDTALPPGFEPQPSSIPVGIEIKNLRKMYSRKKVAVDSISLKMYAGEIFVLLGHNGAGKTTTISMLSGICAPTSGTAQINGYDIRHQLDKVRENLGLCPQYNMLFDKLTVNEHFIFFGKLKGLSGKNIRTELDNLIKSLQLWEKRDTLSKYLSGGQKRKLHLGIALIGKTGVAILDEPTSGMDPEARRAIWDVLLEMHGDRTILLTTHFMEEADVLGHRIAILASGVVQCCGTSSFLKNYYGAGYTLKLGLILREGESASRSVSPAASRHSRLSLAKEVSFARVETDPRIPGILEFVQKHVPDAFLKTMNSANVREVFITLPSASATTTALASLFSELPGEKQRLGISTVGMGHTTMDEVFLKVGELADKSTLQEVDDTQIDVPSGSVHRKNKKASTKLAMVQFKALLVKKILYTYRKRKLVICQVIVPVMLLIGAILSCNGFFAPLGHPEPVVITLENYDKPIIPVATTDDQTYKDISAVTGSSIARKIDVDLTRTTLAEKLLHIANQSVDQYNNQYIAGAQVVQDQFTALYSTVPNHAAPLAINIASNTLLRQMAPGKNYRIQVTNHPMRTDVKLVLGTTKPEANHVFYATVLFEVFMPIGLALLAATFTVLPMEEKLCKAKQLQMMTGVHPMIYWGSAYLWDYGVVIVVICMMLACLPIFQSHVMYTSYGGTGVAFLILMVYGYCAIFFSYLMSHFAKTVQGAFAFVTIIHIVSGLVIGVVISATDTLVIFTEYSLTRQTLQFIGRLFPTYGAVISTTRYVETAIDNGRCNVLTPKVKQQLCDNPWTVSGSLSAIVEYLECCDECQTTLNQLESVKGSYKPSRSARSVYETEPECFQPKPYILWANARKSLRDTEITVPGIAQELTIMLVMSFVYLAALMAMEYRHSIIYRVGKISEGKSGKVEPGEEGGLEENEEDEDVMEEAKRMEELVSEKMLKEDALIVHGLRKTFGGYSAVRRISFGVHHGECFGLLGVNGAGKTTTFRMLTGDETPSSGEVYALGKGLHNNRKKYLQSVGYCPQFDGIIDVLTGKEMLVLFCRLRGISGKMGKTEAQKWLKKLGLEGSGSVQCKNYSGGMLRRLCAAIAMVGDPAIILLDEPTSGVDPVSRRQFWKVIQSVRNSGQAIILTSHSMEECETLCSRLGIMVNGELQCLGGVQHLKAKFAQGYTLSLKLKQAISVDSEEFVPFHNKIEEVFQPCVVKDKHNNFIQYEIQNPEITWEYLFKTMEEVKGAFQEFIEDYSVNETSLEEVFLSFARKQYGERQAPKTCPFCAY